MLIPMFLALSTGAIASVTPYGILGDNWTNVKSIELPIIKTPEGPIKTRLLDSLIDESYALDLMASPYIEDQAIKKQISKRFWCGTPRGDYLSRNPMPSEEFLRKRAKKMEAEWRENFSKKR